jgi:undecaprenyl-diphosphatase
MNYNIFNGINQMAGHYAWLDAIMVFLANDGIYAFFAVLVLLWLTGREKHQKTVFFSCLAASAALLIASQIISPIVNHPRPFIDHIVHQLINHSKDPSFPSDHATLAFSIAITVWFRNRLWGAYLLILSVLIGISRVYVGVHYPADIVGGAILAWACSLIVIKYRKQLDPIPLLFIRVYQKLTASIPFIPNSNK